MKYHERSLLVAISAKMAKQARMLYYRDRKWKLSNIKILLYKPINQNNSNRLLNQQTNHVLSFYTFLLTFTKWKAPQSLFTVTSLTFCTLAIAYHRYHLLIC